MEAVWATHFITVMSAINHAPVTLSSKLVDVCPLIAKMATSSTPTGSVYPFVGRTGSGQENPAHALKDLT